MNNRPPISSSKVIDSYRNRRQRRAPNIIFIIAGILVLGGVILLVVWLVEPQKRINAFLATETPTPTMTFTPTNTSTPTETPTITPTFTSTPTATASAPFAYKVGDGDTLTSIVEKYNLGQEGIALIMMLNLYGGIDAETGLPIGIDPITQSIMPGQTITLPYPGMPLPTPTPISVDLPRGSKLDYTIQSGDTLGGIADRFNSTVDDIMKENNITDPNALFAGQIIKVPANLVTVTPTRPPTSTPVTPGPGTLLPTITLTPVNN